jgi:SAM-dependent methyltransferase
LTAAGKRVFDVTVQPHEDAYREMSHYSSEAARDAKSVARSNHARRIARAAQMTVEERTRFPLPAHVWLDAKYELAAQAAAYQHVRPVEGARVLQLGGRGAQAVMLLLAGAEYAWIATPMVGELLFAEALAHHFGVADRLATVAAMAERLPFKDSSFDIVYSQGCVHHWVVGLAIPECARVLGPGGRFAAVEPWRGPLYGAGIRLLGKRDRGVQCQVLTWDRIADPLTALRAFRVDHHGTLTRYALLGLRKAGVKPSTKLMWRIAVADDAVSSRLRLRQYGSSVAIVGVEAAERGLEGSVRPER